MGRALFVEVFGDIFEHSPQIAERVHAAGLRPEADTPEGLQAAMTRAMRSLDRGAKMALIRAHPDLAGRLALRRQLTAQSTGEQAGAGLDRLTAADVDRFTALNDAYREKFGFPFIIAVKGLGATDILAAFESRIGHEADIEFDQACAEIEKIALLRLRDRMASA